MSTRSPSRVLVIAAHPDDEVLGCGGTVALHARAGDEVHTAIACEGESLRYGRAGVGQPEHICRAARTLGVRDVRMLGFPDQRLDTLTLTDIIGSLTSLVREIHPDIVYCQHGGDVISAPALARRAPQPRQGLGQPDLPGGRGGVSHRPPDAPQW